MEATIVVRHNPSASRYEAEVEGRLVTADYVRDGDRVVFTHTYVPADLRGRGVAKQLVRNALEDVRLQRLRVTAQCSYVAAFIRQNPQFESLLAE